MRIVICLVDYLWPNIDPKLGKVLEKLMRMNIKSLMTNQYEKALSAKLCLTLQNKM